MGSYNQLKTAIQSVIKANGAQEITGDVLQKSLLSMVNSLGKNSTFGGVINPSSPNPNVDENVFYIASQTGVYTSFNVSITSPGIYIVAMDGAPSWAAVPVILFTEDMGDDANKLMNQKGITTAIKSSLRELYETIPGVKYNGVTGLFEIYKEDGGLDNITEAQMRAIYNAGHIWGIGTFSGQNIPIPLQDSVVRQTDARLDLSRLFERSYCKLVCINKYGLRPVKIDYIFTNCIYLERVTSFISFQFIENVPIDPFTRCLKLATIRLKQLNVDISFKDSPLLTVDDYDPNTSDDKLSSLGYLVKYAANSSAITVTLHPTAFDKVPQGLKDKATNKQISIAKAL